MKRRTITKHSAPATKFSKPNKFSIDDDPFFNKSATKKARRNEELDAMIDSDESESDDQEVGGDGGEGEDEESEFANETVAEKKKRLATALVERIRASEKRRKDSDGDDDDDDDEGGSEDEENEGDRDSRVSKILQQKQLEDSGRVRRLIASRVKKPEKDDSFRILVKQRQTVTAVALSEDDLKGYSASKDGTIINWDVDCGKVEKYQWPSEEVLKKHGSREPQGGAKKRSKHVLALAVSSDGRYLASGGLDRHVHLWDTRTRQHIQLDRILTVLIERRNRSSDAMRLGFFNQAFQGHRGPVSCLTFRQGTSELFSGSYDRTLKIWNADDRAYINSLFGHQSEVLGIDCLRKERLLTVGRDRSMQLWKVPEESRLVFCAPASSLECCSYINNDEFLTGSDDGSVALWGILKKKPVCIVKNAHALTTSSKNLDKSDTKSATSLENGNHDAERSNCSSAQSWVSSISVCTNSDLAASGAGNGCVRVWGIDNEPKALRSLCDLPLDGFVNSLAFANSGRFLVAAVGQEPRLGRWGKIPTAQNGVTLHSLNLS